jgi:hypothetical protein
MELSPDNQFSIAIKTTIIRNDGIDIQSKRNVRCINLKKIKMGGLGVDQFPIQVLDRKCVIFTML